MTSVCVGSEFSQWRGLVCHCSWEIALSHQSQWDICHFASLGPGFQAKCLRKQAVSWKTGKSVVWQPRLYLFICCSSCVRTIAKNAKLCGQKLCCPLSHETPRSSPFSQQLCRSCSFHMVRKVCATVWYCDHQMYHICSGPQMKISLQILIILSCVQLSLKWWHSTPIHVCFQRPAHSDPLSPNPRVKTY